MNKYLSLLWISLYCATVLIAQTNYIKEEWEASPKIKPLEEKYKNESAVYLLDKRRIEFKYEKDELVLYVTLHKIIQVNDDKGIEMFNKIYLPFGESLLLMDVKARTLLPDNKIIELNKSNIKEIKDDDGDQFKIFAMDGLVKGSVVEYFYTFKREPFYFSREIFQTNIPVAVAQFELYSPSNLHFEAKSFNRFPEAVLDTSIAKVRKLQIIDQDIKGYTDEKYSMRRNAVKRVEYKLSYNSARNAKERMFTWNGLAKRLYDIYYTFEEKEEKKAKDLLSDIDIPRNASEKDKIVRIENYIKKNFVSRDDYDAEGSDNIIIIIKNKLASYKGITRLYACLFKHAAINYQLVLTGSRDEKVIERNFENWNNAEYFLFYFPSFKKYLAPTVSYLRYPMIPYLWSATLGLHCQVTSLGNFSSAIAEIKQIPLNEYSKNFINMDVSLVFNKTNDTLLITTKQSYGGYSKADYSAGFVLAPKDEQEKLLKEMVKFGSKSEDIITSSFENKEFESDYEKPFIINATVRSTELLEKAGNKILFKLGEVIGPQVEMYDEKPRVFDVQMQYPHQQVRTIEFTIPDGYKIKNLNDLLFDITKKENNVVEMGFVSTYTQEGNKIKVVVTEDYRNIFYPLEQYDFFKKVINTSADFNKVVLVLEK